ncbi:hypothetical protein LCGC14_2067450 [marine sediment metagenome]|uniref:Uncharacterized protein n=1 Tax=marine sediment metagenome TaxID=412755 RepID=A0A0F9EJB1_9ZZZZ
MSKELNAPNGISVDQLNEALAGFEIAVKKEPMLTHVAQFIAAEFKVQGFEVRGEGGEKRTELYLDGFSAGFCYLAIMLKTGEMKMECL